MPRHLAIATAIGTGIYSLARNQGIKYALRLKNKEDKLWKGLYPHKGSRWIVRGSIAAGDLARQIKDSDNPEMDAQIPFKQSTPGSSNKARRGRGGNSGRYTKCRCGPNRNRGRSSFSKFKRSRNRF